MKNKNLIIFSHMIQDQASQIANLGPNEKFSDSIFMPDNSSIFSGLTPFGKGKNKEIYILKRLTDLAEFNELNILELPKNYDEDPDVISEDVVQGQLGDCYMLSAMSALAEFPKRIKHLFLETKVNPKGFFRIKVFLHGIPQIIVIDDYFPFIKDMALSDMEANNGKVKISSIAFCGINTKTMNIWAMLLEKVWAKVNGTYESIISGNCSEVFEFFSPSPFITNYHLGTKDNLFELIKDADEKDYVICCDITDNGTQNLAALQNAGLLTNHAYSLIDAAEVIDRDGKPARLFKIRNPWGSHEWTGDWSDQSPKWTPELKRQLNFSEDDDGTFWICYEDYLRFYTTTHISFIRDSFYFSYSKFKCDLTSAATIIEINIPRETKGFFIINQKNVRIYRNLKNRENYENAYLAFHVVKKENNGELLIIGSCSGKKSRYYVESEKISKGKYLLIVYYPKAKDRIDSPKRFICDEEIEHQMQECDEQNLNFVASTYCDIDKLDFNLADYSENEKLNLIYEMMRKLGITSSEKYYFKDEGESKAYRSISFETRKGALGYIYYNNYTEACIKERFKFTSFYGCTLIPVEFKVNETMLKSIGKESQDIQERTIIKNLINEFMESNSSKSTLQLLSSINNEKPIDNFNSLQFQVSVSPFTEYLYLICKYDESAGMNFTSDAVLTYPFHSLLNESKFYSNMVCNNLKYSNQESELYEVVIENNSGVILKYKNRTNLTGQPLSAKLKISFTSLFNLNIRLDKVNTGSIALSELDDVSSIEKRRVDDFKYVHQEILEVNPGEMKILMLEVIDAFKEFNYSCEVGYELGLYVK